MRDSRKASPSSPGPCAQTSRRVFAFRGTGTGSARRFGGLPPAPARKAGEGVPESRQRSALAPVFAGKSACRAAFRKSPVDLSGGSG